MVLSMLYLGVALIANEEKILKMLTMTAEPGIIGGLSIIF